LNKPITVAVTGASGLLGRPLMTKLTTDPRFQQKGAAWSRAGGSLDRVDITSTAAVEAWLDKVKPDVLVHLAAERRPDVYAVDPEAADRLNIDATEALAGCCTEREINLIFVSTNYVFDGTSPPYRPEDNTNPLNAYGRSKLAGENAVLASSSGNRVLRVPMFHGPSESLDESPVTLLARGFLETGGPVELDVIQTRYPAFAPDIATVIVGLLPGLAAGTLPGPVFQFCPGESFTKRDMGEIIAGLIAADSSRAVADERPPRGALRPENTRMLSPHLDSLGLMKTTEFREAIKISLESIRSAGGLPRI
jgi:dTDP-4-dehydrorhamnose reductase